VALVDDDFMKINSTGNAALFSPVKRCGNRDREIGASLAPQVFDILQYLIRNCQRFVSEHDPLASIWDGRVVLPIYPHDPVIEDRSLA
jgi:DNA-binding response OmpR family regulator